MSAFITLCQNCVRECLNGDRATTPGRGDTDPARVFPLDDVSAEHLEISPNPVDAQVFHRVGGREELVQSFCLHVRKVDVHALAELIDLDAGTGVHQPIPLAALSLDRGATLLLVEQGGNGAFSAFVGRCGHFKRGLGSAGSNEDEIELALTLNWLRDHSRVTFDGLDDGSCDLLRVIHSMLHVVSNTAHKLPSSTGRVMAEAPPRQANALVRRPRGASSTRRPVQA